MAVEELGAKIPVVIGLYHLHAVAALGLHAREVDADGLLSTPPPYAAPTPREILRDLRQRRLAITVYNWARRGRDYLGDSDRAGKIRSVVAIKDNPVNKIQVFKTREKVGDRIDRLGLSVLRDLGGDGNINGGDLGVRGGILRSILAR